MERPGGAPSRGGPKGKILDLNPSVPLRIVTAAGSPNYYVKVVDWETHAAKLAFFVRSGEVATLEICNGLENLDKKSAFLRWWAALKMKESQCPERARVTHPA